MGKFEVAKQAVGEKLVLQMSGVIDEDADFAQASIIGSKDIEINLSQVKSINSCGIREWIKWLSAVPSAKIVFHQCPKVIVDQMNMVDGFLPTNAQVLSFYVPYYNDDAGTEKNILFKQGQEYGPEGLKLPESVKDDDGNEMEIDVIESKYFKFLKS